MNMIFLRIVFIFVVLNCLSIFAFAEDKKKDWRTMPFRQQLIESNKRYLYNETDSFMHKLNNINGELKSSYGTKLSERLTKGDNSENQIIRLVGGLIKFQIEHNEMVDNWSKEDAISDLFLRPIKMDASLVKEIKKLKYPNPWQYVAVHWYPKAFKLKAHEHPIPKAGLNLTPEMWNVNDEINKESDIQRYAIFSFYRKLAQYQNYDINFLNNETGFRSFWSVNDEKIEMERWKYSKYYTYKYIPPKNVPDANPDSLKSYIIKNVCSLKKKSKSLTSFYNNKLTLYHDILNEMEDEDNNIDVYWSLYNFVCQTFPCISSFKISAVEASNVIYKFVNGYKGDKPAKKTFSSGNSVVGHAYRLFRTFDFGGDEKEAARKLLTPIQMLQLERIETDSFPRDEFPYTDIKVGFKGFLDFYNEVVN